MPPLILLTEPALVMVVDLFVMPPLVARVRIVLVHVCASVHG